MPPQRGAGFAVTRHLRCLMSSVTHFIRELTMFGSLGSVKGVTRVSVGFSDLFCWHLFPDASSQVHSFMQDSCNLNTIYCDLSIEDNVLASPYPR